MTRPNPNKGLLIANLLIDMYESGGAAYATGPHVRDRDSYIPEGQNTSPASGREATEQLGTGGLVMESSGLVSSRPTGLKDTLANHMTTRSETIAAVKSLQ